MIAHYRHNRVDPMTKTLIFSDGLTIEKPLRSTNSSVVVANSHLALAPT